MQPGVTVVLATVWLVVYANAVGTATHRPSRLTLDQYSPSHRHHRRHGVYGGNEEDQLGWKDRNPVEDHQVHASIPRSRSQNKLPPIHETESKEDPFKDLDLVIYRSRGYEKDVSGYSSSLSEDARQSSEFTEERVNEEDDDTKESSRRELSPPSELEDPFVADDTFQDQGPGSVEIYKLDLLLLDPTPATRLPFKGKAPKKTWHWKSKEASPNMLRKQSNAIPFGESRTENPAFNDPFSVGGVPELQVGCEGLEASDPTGRDKRSIDVSKEKRRDVDPWTGVTPITLDLDYEEEGGYEEMDELLKLKKLETTTVGVKRNRGDMEATLDFHRDEVDAEKLPVRGDLGKTGSGNESEPEGKSSHFNKAKRDIGSRFPTRGANQRKILWLDNPGEEKRRSRDVWGFAEDEGVISSDELQTVNQRRRLAYERRLKEEEERRRREEERRRREEERRSYAENRTNTDIERIREEYERSLELRRRQDEERRRRLQQETQPTNRWQTEEERRRLREEQSRRNRWQDEERRRQELESRTRYDPRTYEEERKRQRQQEEEMRRREENRLREQRRLQEEAEARRREMDSRSLEERNRIWMMKQRQEEEERRRRQQARSEPSNLLHPSRVGPNVTGSYDREAERRLWEQRERERQRKLNEYIERNRPINANGSIDRRREEANRRRQEDERMRRLEEERKLQEYVRRNQPMRVPKVNESDGRGFEYRRRPDEAREYDRSRYPGPGSGRRNHGPSAPTNIDPWSAEAGRREAARRIEEERIRERQRKEQEDLRRDALRREQEQRWMQSRRYEEQRKRQLAERLAREEQEKARRRSQLGGTAESTGLGDRRRFPEPGRRQDTSLIPANLVSNESRRAAERQRQEMERRRLEAERQRQEQAREKEARQNEQRASHLKELRRRQEEARLNALPVSARIIVKPSSVPNVITRMGGTDIDFPGVSPHRPGVPVSNFPSPPTQRPPAKSPPPCVWAVVHCCSSVTNNRLVLCFETMGCPGVNWDPNPCRVSVVTAARDEVRRFYDENDEMDSRSHFH